MTTDSATPPQRTRRLQQGEKLRSADKVERIPVKVIPTTEIQRKPEWMRIRLTASPKVQQIKKYSVNTRWQLFVKRPPAPICMSALAMVLRHL